MRTHLCDKTYADMRYTTNLLAVLLGCLCWQCQTDTGQGNEDNAGFSRRTARQTGIRFVNTIQEDEDKNVLHYEYFYNGGGVAVGDLNQDGLPDLYFTGNMVSNQLYLNKGGLSFREVTSVAGVGGRDDGWNTGVTLVDINSDGLLDIYLCYSGDGAPDQRRNALYINQGSDQDGIPTFLEQAARYGLDSPAHTTQALFFDYDHDGDLDAYLLNHATDDFQSFDATYVKKLSDPYAGDKLLRNDDGTFIEVTEEAGIKSTPLGFGLGIAASDVNNDGWLDLYVSNDYIEEDYLYINQQDGTFRDVLKEQIGHISHFSMGSDIADINNDGHTDILSLDMLPEDNRRQKLLYGPDTYEKYQSMLRNGFFHQIMRNMLQLNNGDGTFSEIGQLAGISNTDWSWAPIFADFDNDGWKDLFVSNGYLRDYTNRDFVSYYADQRIKAQRGESSDPLMEIIARMESTKTPNYIFQNQGDLTFTDKSKAWGFDELVLTNGAAQADLDGDGDLDLVLNNNNAEATIYENKAAKGNYLQVHLRQPEGANQFAIGSRVELITSNGKQVQEFMPSRGFQSAMHHSLHFGLGDVPSIDTLRVRWPDGTWTQQTQVAANQLLVIDRRPSTPIAYEPVVTAPLFRESESSIAYIHKENSDIDFKRQSLLPWGISYQGPTSVQADFNGDGIVDLFIGGAKRQAPVLKTGNSDGSFTDSRQPDLTSSLIREDVASVAFDADGDGDTDLYVGSGGYHYLPEDLALQDRLYLNDGSGFLAEAKDALPLMRTSTGAVAAEDIDQDGDIDLFVGGRLIPGQYPRAPRSYILRNNGQGKFTDVTSEVAPGLSTIGMVTSALWQDVNGDNIPDLVVAGEWMPLTCFINQDGQLAKQPDFFGPKTEGWWWTLEKADLDGDGDQDLIAGNLGKNTNLKVGPDKPARLYFGDFDNNGAVDPVLTHYIQGKPYPFVSRDNLFGQLSGLRKVFTSYAAYSEAQIEDILSADQLEQARVLSVHQGASVWIEQQEQGSWQMHELPAAAQMAPVFAIQPIDVNQDNQLDLILAGNLADTRPTMGPWDANYGQVFINHGNGHFTYLPQTQSGLSIIGDVRSMEHLKYGDRHEVLFLRNNQSAIRYRLQPKKQLIQ